MDREKASPHWQLRQLLSHPVKLLREDAAGFTAEFLLSVCGAMFGLCVCVFLPTTTTTITSVAATALCLSSPLARWGLIKSGAHFARAF